MEFGIDILAMLFAAAFIAAFIDAIKEMKRTFGIGNTVAEIQETDIPKLTHYADKEANPLYPVPVLMNAKELEKFYYMLMPEED